MVAEHRHAGMVVLLLGATLAAALPATAADGSRVWSGTWGLDTPLGEATGPLLMVENGPDGSWRCEVAVAENGIWPTPDGLRHRLGRGWTLTGTPDGGFVQPWDEPWRALGPSATGAVGNLLGQLIAGDPSRRAPSGGHFRRWRLSDVRRPAPVILNDWEGLPASWRPPLEGPPHGGALRRRLATRGRGRGGDGLVLDLHWKNGALFATSARWPGRVTLNLTTAEPADIPAEAFLPLWPLAEFLP